MPIGPKNYNLLEEKDFSISRFYENVCRQPAGTSFLICVPDPTSLLQKISSELQLIEAAGGLVQNASGAYLFIFRRGKWDLPKGKIDAGEGVEEAAVREVEEECGVKVSELGNLICSTYHIYPYKDRLAFKKTYWYAMKVEGIPPLIPQTEEDITDALWLKAEELEQVKANTFPLILEVIDGME